ncbi:hypothetical protein AOLI_G00091840 [Acnodon oligacanthus]
MSSNTGTAALKAHLGTNDQQGRKYADTVSKLALTALAQLASTHRELENAHEQAAATPRASQKQIGEKAREPEFSCRVNCSQTTEQGSYPNLAEPVSPQPLHQPWSPPHAQVPSDGDLDKIARNIAYFEPTPEGSSDIHSYLKDIDYYLRRFPNATVEERIYLIRRTSSQEVSQFIERQPNSVRSHHNVLCQALIEEFSNHLAQTGLVAALAVKHRRESPQQYYSRLRLVYFGSRNEPGMEEDLHFKTLFVHNLHPTTSNYLGITACPQTLSSRQLRDLALKGFAKHLQALSKWKEAPSVINFGTQGSSSASSPRHQTIKVQDLSRPQHSHYGRYRSPPLWDDKSQSHLDLVSNQVLPRYQNQVPPNGRSKQQTWKRGKDNGRPLQTVHPGGERKSSPPCHKSEGAGRLTHRYQRKSGNPEVESDTLKRLKGLRFQTSSPDAPKPSWMVRESGDINLGMTVPTSPQQEIPHSAS